MSHPSKSYARRGDVERRRSWIQRVLVVVLFVAAVALVRRAPMQDANAKAMRFGNPFAVDVRSLREELDGVRGELTLTAAQLQRANRIIGYSTRYKITADLAAAIYDVSLASGVEPELGFRLVNVESEFNPHATSHAGAIGLTQVMPATAAELEKGVTRAQLYDPRTNLRIGFGYLRDLIKENKGDVKLALLIYNRGPEVVSTMRALGLDPRNGYDTAVMKGYSGKGLIE